MADERWQHLARLEDPDKYIRFRMDWEAFDDGICAQYGELELGGEELQAILFDGWVFTEVGAKKWLEVNGYTVLKFVPATVKVQAADAGLPDPIIIAGYRAMTPGVYRPASPPRDVTVEDADINDWIDAVNIKAEKGAPVVLKVQHRDALEAIEVGTVQRAWKSGADAYIDIAVLSDAIYKGEIVRTQQQLADGIRTGMMTCSWEGWYNYQSPGYTGDRTFRVWPTGYAILLGGDQPAIPSAIPAAANDNIDPTGIYLRGIATAPARGVNPPERGNAMALTLEEAMKEIEALKAKIKDLEAAADKGKSDEVATATKRATSAEGRATAAEAELAKYRQAEADALKAKCADLTETVLKRVIPGKRDGLKAKLEAMDGDATRVQFLESMADNLPELTPEQKKTLNGEADGADAEAKKVSEQKKAINAAADTHNLDLRTRQGADAALKYAQRDNPELFKG